MKDLHVSSLPLLGVLQKACETLVIHNHVMMVTKYNVVKRTALSNESAMATTLVEHIRDVIANNQPDV
jgi:hypothetical protein